jgi:hypothetical protein
MFDPELDGAVFSMEGKEALERDDFWQAKTSPLVLCFCEQFYDSVIPPKAILLYVPARMSRSRAGGMSTSVNACDGNA